MQSLLRDRSLITRGGEGVGWRKINTMHDAWQKDRIKISKKQKQKSGENRFNIADVYILHFLVKF
jgi:hypothetical protein